MGSTRPPNSPTFLDYDPYPSRSRDGRPVSVGSATTDATSEFSYGDEPSSPRFGQKNSSAIPGATGPVGEPGLPPSRPVGDALQSRGGPLRPNNSTVTSGTHVPTLTAQGFSKPLSSQQLQTQRSKGIQPQTAVGSSSPQNKTSSSQAPQDARNNQTKEKTPRRYSDASVNTLRDQQRAVALADEEVPPLPTSRGTQFTNENTAPSVTSTAPLQPQSSQGRNTPRPIDTNGHSNEKPQKSPRSFRASLGLGSRNSRQEESRPSPRQTQHEKLDSSPSTPNTNVASEKANGTLPTHNASKDSSKNYEYTASAHLFFLSGRLLNTRAKPLNVATFILTVLPCCLFFGFEAPWLWHNISPAIPIIFAYVVFVCVSSFLHAAFSDPGILPRNVHPHPPNPRENDPLVVGPQTTEWVMVKTFPSATTNKNHANENGTAAPHTAMEVPTKYCKTCNIWRPPRGHHCRICDACVETQDHHCVWLNNCVGRRNYRYFFAYVSSASVMAIMLLAFSITQIVYYGRRHQPQRLSFSESLSGRTQERVAFALFLYSLLALSYPLSLCAYHLFLIARGETTREYLNSHKFPKKDRHRPFSQATALRNWMSVLLRPRPPTYMQFKDRHQPGDVRYGYQQPKKLRKAEHKGRYSVGPGGASSGNGIEGNGNTKAAAKPGDGAGGTGGEVEMKQLGKAGKVLGSGGGNGVVDRTPR